MRQLGRNRKDGYSERFIALGSLILDTITSSELWARVGFSLERLFNDTDAFVSRTVLRSTLSSVRYACFQFIEIERACIGV
jgi:hypothetical protein